MSDHWDQEDSRDQKVHQVQLEILDARDQLVQRVHREILVHWEFQV